MVLGPRSAGPPREVVYAPQGEAGTTFAAWQAMGRELWSARELTWRLVWRDLSARYRQSILGYVWAVAPPLVAAATFSWLGRARILRIDDTGIPYPAFVLLGVTVWQLFATGLALCTQCLVGAGSLVTKLNFPRETLIVAAFGQSIFDFLIRSLLVAIGFAVYGVVPSWTVALVPMALLPLCLLSIGLGFVLALANGVMRDIGQVVAVGLMFWMLLTPVAYPAATDGTRLVLNFVNPVSPFVIAAQDLTVRGTLSQPVAYSVGVVVSTVVFLLGWRIFHLAASRIAERV